MLQKSNISRPPSFPMTSRRKSRSVERNLSLPVRSMILMRAGQVRLAVSQTQSRPFLSLVRRNSPLVITWNIPTLWQEVTSHSTDLVSRSQMRRE